MLYLLILGGVVNLSFWFACFLSVLAFTSTQHDKGRDTKREFCGLGIISERVLDKFSSFLSGFYIILFCFGGSGSIFRFSGVFCVDSAIFVPQYPLPLGPIEQYHYTIIFVYFSILE